MFRFLCEQFPSMIQVMHHVGMFFYWHIWNVTTGGGRIICWPS